MPFAGVRVIVGCDPTVFEITSAAELRRGDTSTAQSLLDEIERFAGKRGHGDAVLHDAESCIHGEAQKRRHFPKREAVKYDNSHRGRSVKVLRDVAPSGYRGQLVIDPRR
jgi:hypothetical protein